MADTGQFRDFAVIKGIDLSGFALSARKAGMAMIDPIVEGVLGVAFAVTVASVVLARRTAERAREQRPSERRADAEHRYVNGGWR